jgi:hypothetical protein
VGLLSIFAGLMPLGAAILYAVRPTEQRLAMMRPLSLATIFAALAGTVLGALNVLRWLGTTQPPPETRIIAIAAAESLVPLFTGFGALAVAWVCVAFGQRRAQE